MATRSLPRVHYRLGFDVRSHISKRCIRGGGCPGYKNLIRYKRGIVIAENDIYENFLFLFTERESKLGREIVFLFIISEIRYKRVRYKRGTL